MPSAARRPLALLLSALCLLLLGASAARADVYWVNSDSSTIGRAANAGGSANTSFVQADSTLGGGVVADGAHLYWSQWWGGIARANLDGSGVEEDFVVTPGQTGSLAIDGGHLYWSTPNETLIGRVRLDGSDVDPDFVAVEDDGYPDGVATDGTYVYWTDSLGRIGRVRADGSDAQPALVSGLDTPTQLTISGGLLYWADSGLNAIGRARADGGSVSRRWKTTSTVPNGVSVGGGYVYWSEPTAGRIGRVTVAGASANASFITGLDWPQGLYVTAPAFSAAPTAPAFGNVGLGSSAAQTVTVTNDVPTWSGQPLTFGSGAVRLTGTSANQFSIAADGCSGQSVAPGASCQVTISFTPTTVGSKSATVRFTDNAGGSPQSLTLSGRGTQGAATVAPLSGDYGEVRTATTSAAQSFTVTNAATGANAGDIAFAAGAATLTGSDPGAFSISADGCSGTTVAPAATCTVDVVFAPTAEGAASAALQLVDDAPGSPRTIPLSGTGVAPLLTLDPVAHDFGSVLVGASAGPLELTVANDGSGPATLPPAPAAAALGGAGAAAFAIADDSCSGATLATGETCTLAVAFSPTAAGAVAATLTVADDGGTTLSAALTGTGEEPARPDPDPRPDPLPDPPLPDPPLPNPPLPDAPLPNPPLPDPPATPLPTPPTPPTPGGRTPARRTAKPRLTATVAGTGAAATAVVGEDGTARLRCALAGATLRGCAAVATAADGGQRLGGGSASGGRRAATVAVRLDARGRAALAHALGGLRVVVTVTATTRDGGRVVRRLHVTLLAKRQQVVTRAGAFAPDGAALTPAGAAFLREVAHRLRGVRAIVCTGFTATRGEQGSDAAADALGLSRGRAACALLRRLGADVRLSARSGGRGRPRAGNDSAAGRDRNRRVELTIMR